jgi:branched-chain amino acid transport system substrate-binding protein
LLATCRVAAWPPGRTAPSPRPRSSSSRCWSYRTGPYAPNGVPWANGYADYLKLVNARGGINGVKIIFEECETGYDTAAAWSATSA